MNGMTEEIEQNAWYTIDGEDNDVICSTKVTLARNLMDFPFPKYLKNEDKKRVETIIFDAFSQLNQKNSYQSFTMRNLEYLGRHILTERGILDQEMVDMDDAGAVVRDDGIVACTVNCRDHLRCTSFSSGYAVDSCFKVISELDRSLQKTLHFAGNDRFGYFTSSLHETGTGMHTSLVVHLPSIVYAEKQDELFRSLIESGFELYACYAKRNDSRAKALGAWFMITAKSCFPDSEVDQIAETYAMSRNIIEVERRTRCDLLDRKPTYLKDRILRSIAVIKYSRFINFDEGFELVSALKWGFDLGFLSGVDESSFYALLFRIQSAHLTFIERTGNLSFEKDVLTPEQRINRLRAIILQEAVSEYHINIR